MRSYFEWETCLSLSLGKNKRGKSNLGRLDLGWVLSVAQSKLLFLSRDTYWNFLEISGE